MVVWRYHVHVVLLWIVKHRHGVWVWVRVRWRVQGIREMGEDGIGVKGKWIWYWNWVRLFRFPVSRHDCKEKGKKSGKLFKIRVR